MDHSDLLLWQRDAGARSLPDRRSPSYGWLTAEERTVVERVVSDIPTRDGVHLLATLYGVKRGCLIGEWISEENLESSASTVSAIRESDQMLVEEMCRRLGLPHIAKIEALRDKTAILAQTFIARSPAVLDSVPPFYKRARMDTVTDHYGEEWGYFLGVPDEDNVWYWESDMTGDFDKVTPLAETVSVSLSPVEEWFAHLVPYIPRPTPDGIDRAVSEGRRYAEAVYQFRGADGLKTVVEKTQFGISENDWTAETREVSGAEVVSALSDLP